MYNFLRKLLFLLPPEEVHYYTMNTLRGIADIPFLKKAFTKKFTCPDVALTKNVFGLNFKNPVGLGAGFDKNALYLQELEMLGFGFVETGTVTPLPQKGNEKPRLFRLPKDQALINRMGFNNDGLHIVKQRLEKWKKNQSQTSNKLIIGGNIGKNKATPNEDAWKDYETCFSSLFDFADYFVVNVSSPNTPNLRELQEKDALRKILFHLQNINHAKPFKKPLLLKISPDLTQPQLDDIIDLAFEVNLDGIVATNTTISRFHLMSAKSEIEKAGDGGLSGRPLQRRSSEIVSYISAQTNNKIPIIACGGIFSAKDAIEKFEAGAALVQIWTGFVYKGPSLAKNICSSILKQQKL